MKKQVLILALVLLVLPSCKKESWLDWKTENQLWLVDNAKQEGVIVTPSGLQYKVLREGIPSQPKPDALKSVVVTYKGSLITGNVFDKGEDKSMAVSSLIKGFAEGLCKMSPPAHYILYIPSNLAYDKEGAGTEGIKGFIPPYSTLIFDVELKQVY